jgi:hypothetical protein
VKPASLSPRHQRLGLVIVVVAPIATIALVVFVAATHWSASPDTSLNLSVAPATNASPNTRRNGGVAPATGASLHWVPLNALFHHMSGAAAGGFAVKVRPRKLGGYGVQIPAIVLNPVRGNRFRISLWLRGLSTVSVWIDVMEYGPGRLSRYTLTKSVAVTRKWRHVSFAGRVTGRGPWTGLGLLVFDSTEITVGSSFAIRGLKVTTEKA